MVTKYLTCNCVIVTVVIVAVIGGVLLSIPFPNQDIITAIRADDARLVESLIDAQIRDNSPAKRHIWYADDIDLGYHRSPLLVAARYGAFAVSEMLLKKGGSNVNRAIDLDGATPLHEAAAFDASGRVVRLLLQHGASVDLLSKKERWTPLFNAILFSNVEGVRALVEHGADLTKRIYTFMPVIGESPLEFCMRRSTGAVARLLIRAGAQLQPGDEGHDKYIFLKAQVDTEREQERERERELELEAEAEAEDG